MKYGVMNLKAGADPAVIQQMIDATLDKKEKEGKVDDVRSYAKIEDFPYYMETVVIEGRAHYYTKPNAPLTAAAALTINSSIYLSEDTEYIAEDTRTEYLWKKFEDRSVHSGEYLMVNEVATDSEIKDVFN